jgi:hypothetical protein
VEEQVLGPEPAQVPAQVPAEEQVPGLEIPDGAVLLDRRHQD